jgi:hypothetical protein
MPRSRGRGAALDRFGPIKDPVGRTKDGGTFRYSEPRQIVDSGYMIAASAPPA